MLASTVKRFTASFKVRVLRTEMPSCNRWLAYTATTLRCVIFGSSDSIVLNLLAMEFAV